MSGLVFWGDVWGSDVRGSSVQLSQNMWFYSLVAHLAANILLATLVVQVEQFVGCVSLCVGVRTTTFKLHDL